MLPRQSAGKIEAAARSIEGGGTDGSGSPSPGKVSRERSETAQVRDEVRREKPEITHHLKSITKKEDKTSKQIVKELRLIEELLEKGKHPGKDRQRIAEALRAIPPKRHELRLRIAQVKELDVRLGRFDLALLSELRSAFDKVPPGQRPAIRKMALEEREKIRSEERIAVIERFVATYDTNAARIVESAAEAIVKNDIPRAVSWIQAAVRYEEEAEKAIRRIEAVERMLRRIIRLELRQLRRAA